MNKKDRIIQVEKDTCNGLSGAYHKGCAYGLAHRDLHGTIELLRDGVFTNVDSAIRVAKEHAEVPGNFDEIIIVELEVANPVAIVAPVETVRRPLDVIRIQKKGK